jgi:hypothetical protein
MKKLKLLQTKERRFRETVRALLAGEMTGQEAKRQMRERDAPEQDESSE